MIERIEQLLRNNKQFVADQLRLDPEYFDKLAEGQHPEFLWICCSDSRVPPDRITGTLPGDEAIQEVCKFQKAIVGH